MLTISPIKYNNISFGTFFNNVHDDNDRLKYRGDTSICRNDLYFPEVVLYLNDKYKSVPKVNVVMHACSDGEEVYSFLGVLKSMFGKNADKFLPVRARDIEPTHLNLAQKGVYRINRGEYDIANIYMNGNFYDYFDNISNNNFPNPLDAKHSKMIMRYRSPEDTFPKDIKVKDCLRELVNFSQGSIIEDVKVMDFKNTVLFARNFWPYLEKDEINELAKTLSKKMDNSSTLIIGDYDKDYNINKLLESYGFVEVKDNIFELPKYPNYESRIKDIYEYKDFSFYKD